MKKILIIDDEIDVRKTLSTSLKLNDGRYEIMCAEDGQSGLEIVRKFRPDLILLDIMLPGLSGIEVCRSLKTDEEYKSIQIIMLTALSQSENVIEGLSSGADDYIPKPFNMPELLARVKSHLKMKELYEEVKTSKQRYETLLQSLPDVVYKLDLEGNFVFISDSVKKLGFEPQEIIGRHFSEIIHPDDVPLLSRTIVLPKYTGKNTGDNKAPSLFDERRSKERATKNLEFRLAPKERSEGKVDSEGLNVVITIAFGEVVSAGQYNPETKETLGTVGVIRDITERKQVEELLQEHDKRLNALTSSAKDAMIMINSEGNATFWNPAAEQMFGYSMEEIIGKKISELIIPHKYRKKHDTGLANFRKSGIGTIIGKTVELTGLRKNGEEFPIELSISSIYLKNCWHSVGLVRDITERKKTERELLEKEELKATMVMAVTASHEINNPLTGVIGYAESLQSEEDMSEEAKKAAVNIICEQANRISEVLRRFSKIVKPVKKEYLGDTDMIDLEKSKYEE